MVAGKYLSFLQPYEVIEKGRSSLPEASSSFVAVVKSLLL